MTKLMIALTVALSALTGGCFETGDCRTVVCGKDILAGDDTNGRSYEKCFDSAGNGLITTTLTDDTGEVFYECTDEVGKTCTSSSVDAQFAYCGQ
jgi:hypothetical protein